jgi:hypothetical protein
MVMGLARVNRSILVGPFRFMRVYSGLRSARPPAVDKRSFCGLHCGFGGVNLGVIPAVAVSVERFGISLTGGSESLNQIGGLGHRKPIQEPWTRQYEAKPSPSRLVAPLLAVALERQFEQFIQLKIVRSGIGLELSPKLSRNPKIKRLQSAFVLCLGKLKGRTTRRHVVNGGRSSFDGDKTGG